jgi:hypothetical protein
MHIGRLSAVMMMLLMGAGGTAAAQDRGAGVTAGAPSMIGVIWHASDKIAIRPEITLSGGSSSTDSSTFDAESDRWSVGTRVSVLYYLHTYDRLRTYISPSFTYAYTSSTTNSVSATITGISVPSLKTTAHAVGGDGSFGAQYRLADKFSVFGELGFGFSHASSTSNLTPVKSTGNNWSTRTAVGVIFYP